ncbi:hypothetical protein KCU78_g7276, partial [Aureobasidium melanogenum]
MTDPLVTNGAYVIVTDSSTHPFQPVGQKEEKIDLKGYPVVILEDYVGVDVPSRKLKTISVKKGMTGVVHSVSPDWQYVVVLLLGQPTNAVKQGVVPGRIAKIGIDRKHKDIREVRVGTSLTTLAGLTHAHTIGTIADNSVVANTVMRFISEIQNSRRHFPFIPDKRFQAIAKYGGPVGVANKFWLDMKNTNPRLPLVLESHNDFTYLDIMKNCRSATKDDDEHCVSYLESHAKWKISQNQRPKDPAMYGGTTDKRVTKRFPEHDKCLENPDAHGAGAFHYSYCRGSEEMRRVIFAAYEESDFRDLAEQILICLLELQAPFVKKADLASPDFSLEPQATSEDEKKSWLGCLEEMGEEAPKLELGELVDTKIQGKILMEVFNKAKAATGYKGGCSRASFLATVGTNHTSPMGSHGASKEKGFWTETEHKDSIVYRRPYFSTTRTEPRKKQAREIHIVPGGLSSTLTPELERVLPKPGHKLSIAVEIMKPGKGRHKYAYARLPAFKPADAPEITMNPNVSAARANAIGIRIDWEEHTTKKSVWLQCGKPSRSEDGVLLSFKNMEALYRYLTQESYNTGTGPAWMLNFGSARVLKVEMDFLAQTVRLTEKIPSLPRHYDPAREIKSSRQMRADLEKIFPLGAIVRNFASSGPERFSRNSCDKCHLTYLSSRRLVVPCKPTRQEDGSWICESCKQSGFPCCTFTETQSLNGAKQQAIHHLFRSDGVVEQDLEFELHTSFG